MCNAGCDDQLNAAFLLMVFKPPLMIRIATDLRRLVLSRCTSHARLREERIEAVCLFFGLLNVAVTINSMLPSS